MRFRAKDPFLESADLQSEYMSLWTEFARDQIRVARLQAELQGSDQLDLKGLTKTPVADFVVSSIEKLEHDKQVARNEDHRKEKESLAAALKQEDDRYQILTDQLKAEQEDSESDLAEYKQVKQYLERGVMPGTRVAEQRRNVLFSSTRTIQTSAQLAELNQSRVELRRKLEAADNRRRIDLIGELEETRMKLAATQIKLHSVGEKVVYAGMVRSQLVRGTGDSPNITIFRSGRDGEENFAASEDTELQPGDVVEVAVRSEQPPAPPHEASTSEKSTPPASN